MENLLVYTLILLIFLVPVLYVLQPLFQPPLPVSPEDWGDLESLQRRKQLLYRQIKEVEMEYELGHLTAEDYSQARTDLKREVSTVLGAIKAAADK